MKIDLKPHEVELLRDFLGSLNYRSVKTVCKQGVRNLEPTKTDNFLSKLYYELHKRLEQ